jgi:hypothetical protein
MSYVTVATRLYDAAAFADVLDARTMRLWAYNDVASQGLVLRFGSLQTIVYEEVLLMCRDPWREVAAVVAAMVEPCVGGLRAFIAEAEVEALRDGWLMEEEA